MPVKKTSKKKTAKKKVVRKKAAVKKRMACVVCGMEVTVDKICGCVEAHPILCCGQPMARK
ncbi:MAG: hypothetical protein A2176_03500 [Spirochaetes bacterium RBG_13_51_14]|nr:MAG: hypothetical protein A2176_03500 [Spirochaetes bacterium RBG_13_51_14]